jgi:hypothetical protein
MISPKETVIGSMVNRNATALKEATQGGAHRPFVKERR